MIKFFRFLSQVLIKIFFKLFNYPLNIPIKRYVFYKNGVNIFVNTNNSLTYRRWKNFETTGKETETLNWIDSFEDNSVFYDIGANIGVFSVYGAIKKKLNVCSFEPEPNNFIELYNTIKANKLDIIPIMLPLYSNKKNLVLNMSSFGTGHSAHILKSEKLKQDYLISTTDTIDSLIQSKFIEIPNYIKIDTDGNEKEVLLGMEETLRSNIVKSILVELDFIEDLNFVKDYLKKYNFNLTNDNSDGNWNFLFKKES